MKKRVVVGLSGGVDSSVSALLLKQEGYEVIGLFMRNWDSNLNNDILGNKELNENDICPQEQDYNDALKVAEQLGIKLHRIDFVQEYWDYVFTHFIDQYKKGFTPNPDILCNKYIKFNKFLEKAEELFNCDYIAMGHYAGVEFNSKNKQYELHKGVDKNKDQSYFLCQLNQQMLSKSLFPLYKYTKEEVRKIAKDNNLYVADKKDSTGICFIGERDFAKFLENYIPNQPGDIIDIKTNKIVGKHSGVMYYTLGQRKGLNLGGQAQPYYVADKDIDKKIIYVANTDEKSYLYSNECYINEVNWIVNIKNYFDNKDDFQCTAKFRYRQDDQLVRVIKSDDKYKIEFNSPQRAVTPGQEAVLYLNDICLGGGTILNI